MTCNELLVHEWYEHWMVFVFGTFLCLCIYAAGVCYRLALAQKVPENSMEALAMKFKHPRPAADSAEKGKVPPEGVKR